VSWDCREALRQHSAFSPGSFRKLPEEVCVAPTGLYLFYFVHPGYIAAIAKGSDSHRLLTYSVKRLGAETEDPDEEKEHTDKKPRR